MRLWFLCFLVLRLCPEGISALCNNEDQFVKITAYAGDSALLPCSCDSLSTSPQKFRWSMIDKSTNFAVVDQEYRRRRQVQLLNDYSTGNFSLFISHLTEEDEGEYSCTYTVSDMVFIRSIVTVTVRPRITTTNVLTTLPLKEHVTTVADLPPSQSMTYFPFAVVSTFIFHIVFAVVYIFTRTKGSTSVRYTTADPDETVSVQ